MKRSTLSKLALTLVAAFVFVGANAQTNTGSTQWTAATTINDYVQTNATVNVVTVNKSLPFWVWPSALYNPNFDYTLIVPFASSAAISNNVLSNFTFSYYSDATYTTPLVAGDDYTAANQVKNYVEIQFNGTLGAGLYDVTRYIGVEETPTVVTCAGDPVYSTVRVIDQPMMRFSAAGTTQMGLTNVVAIGCEGAAAIQAANTALSVALDNTLENAIGAGVHQRYHVNMTYSVENYNIDGASGSLDLASAASVADPTLKFFGQDAATAPSAENPVFATSETLVLGKDYTVETSKATVYTYTLVEWNAGISRKSDYIAYRTAVAGAGANYGTYSYYTRNIVAAPVLTNRIIVLPKPVTGPIYHIANTWGV